MKKSGIVLLGIFIAVIIAVVLLCGCLESEQKNEFGEAEAFENGDVIVIGEEFEVLHAYRIFTVSWAVDYLDNSSGNFSTVVENHYPCEGNTNFIHVVLSNTTKQKIVYEKKIFRKDFFIQWWENHYTLYITKGSCLSGASYHWLHFKQNQDKTTIVVS